MPEIGQNAIFSALPRLISGGVAQISTSVLFRFLQSARASAPRLLPCRPPPSAAGNDTFDALSRGAPPRLTYWHYCLEQAPFVLAPLSGEMRMGADNLFHRLVRTSRGQKLNTSRDTLAPRRWPAT